MIRPNRRIYSFFLTIAIFALIPDFIHKLYCAITELMEMSG